MVHSNYAGPDPRSVVIRCDVRTTQALGRKLSANMLRRSLLDRDHGPQHLCLASIVLCLLGMVDGRESCLALQAICKKLGR